MAETEFYPISGEGFGDITGSSPQHIIAVRMIVHSITSPRVRPVGTQFPRRLQYAGSFGLWYPSDADTNRAAENTVVWDRNAAWEDMYEYISGLDKWARYAFWNFPPGVAAGLWVVW